MSGDDIADYYVAERPELVAFVKQFGAYTSAIDIGCAGGRLGIALLRERVVDHCDGIEPFLDAAAIAKTVLRQVWQGSLESVGDQISWQDYDLAIMADVLEHLADPWSTLRALHRQTKQECKLVISVPNIRHYKIILPLLFRGEFRYEDQGIMDRTHLHFFTRESLTETLCECGWSVVGIGSHMKKRYRRSYFPTKLLEPFIAVQHFFIAEKR